MVDIADLRITLQELAREIDAELESIANQADPDFGRFDGLMFSLNANWALVRNLYDPATYRPKKQEIEFHNLTLF